MCRPLSFLQLQPAIHSEDAEVTPSPRTFWLMKRNLEGGEVWSMSLKRVTVGPTRLCRFWRNCLRKAPPSKSTREVELLVVRCISGLINRLKICWSWAGTGDGGPLKRSIEFSAKSSILTGRSLVLRKAESSSIITTSELWSWDTLRRLLEIVSGDCGRRRFSEFEDCESSSISITSAELGFKSNFLDCELKAALVTSAFVQSSELLLTDLWHRLLKLTSKRSWISPLIIISTIISWFR